MERNKRFGLISLVLIAALIVCQMTACTPPDTSVSDVSTQNESSVNLSPLPSMQESSQASEDASEQDKQIITGYESKFFVKRLDSRLLHCFAQLYQAAMSFKIMVEFDEPIVDNDLTTLMFLLNYDCPELIQLKGDYYPNYIANSNQQVSGTGLTYCMSKSEYEANMPKLEKLAHQMSSELQGKTDLEKETAVYDWIFNNCVYDESDPLAGSIYGTLISHVGRCEGISKSFMWCMRNLGIECITVSGGQDWDQTAVYRDHSWNLICLEGLWYQVDLTVDNINFSQNSHNLPNYGFFNVDDIAAYEHRAINKLYTELGLPSCSSLDMNYHTKNDLYLQTSENYYEDLHHIIDRCLTENSMDHISVKFYNNAEYKDAVESIRQDVLDYLATVSTENYTVTNYNSDISRTIIIQIEKDLESEE